MLDLATYLTDFGDAGAILPMAISVAGTLLLLRRPALAFRWVAVTLAVAILIVMLKLLGYTLDGTPLGLMAATTPSGHVAGATCAIAGVVALCGARRADVATAGVVVAVVIGITRVALGDHTPAEVVIGGVVGLAGALLLATVASRYPLAGARRPALLGVAVAALLLAHGTHLTWEPEIASASTHLRSALSALL